MSRAFVNEDAGSEREPDYVLPDRASPDFDRAAALVMLEGANAGNTRSAEKATGYAWGEPRLVPHMRELLAEAESLGDERTRQLAGRYLRAADAAED